MTDEQKEFLHLHLIEQINYKTISGKLNVPIKILSMWYEEFKSEREGIAKILKMHSAQKFNSTRMEFYNWYTGLKRKCEYCEITEAEIQSLLDKEQLKTKRLKTRGRKLELDRKIPDLKYEKLDNIVLCCYWCNNAKTDTFTYEEFKEVGKVISKIWKKRLSS